MSVVEAASRWLTRCQITSSSTNNVTAISVSIMGFIRWSVHICYLVSVNMAIPMDNSISTSTLPTLLSSNYLLMNIYHISSLVKFVIGTMILVSSFRFIDPRVDPSSSVIITSVWLILMVWWLGFYAYLLIMSLMSDKKYSYLASYAYKISLLTGAYAAINRLLIGFGVWWWWIGIWLLIVCAFIGGMILGIIQPPQEKEEIMEK